MIKANIRDIKEIRLSGRFDASEPDFPLNWTAAGCDMKVKGSFLDIEIASEYNVYRPYITFEVDGLRGSGANPGRQGIGLEAGATFRLGEKWSTSAGYSFNAIDDSNAHVLNIGVSRTF